MAQATSAELLQRALRLSEDDRLTLAAEILGSIEGRQDPERAKAWAEELNRRVHEAGVGRAHAVPRAEVKSKFEARDQAKCR